MMRLLLLSIFAIVWGWSSNAQCISNRYTDTVFHSVTTTSAIKFATADTYLGISQDLYLDFYEPTADTLSSRPLIVYAFGGGYLIGTRNQPPIPPYCTYFAQCGYAVASIDYRIGFNTIDASSAERAVYRGAQDLRAAVRFLCQHYSQYKIDTTAIFLTGSSAGCFSGLGSCFMEPSDCPTSIHGSTLEPSDLGCYDCSGNTDNNQRMPFIRGIVNQWGAILDTSFIRTTAKDNVPVISFQGDGDNVVPYNAGHPFSYPIFPTVYGSLPIHERLDHLGVKNELHTFFGFGHEPWLLNPQLKDTCYKYTRPFLYSILKPKPINIAGDSTVCLNDRGSYQVPQRLGSQYCWTVTGGTIIATMNNEITVQWATVGSQIITAQELSRNEVNGEIDSCTVHVISRPIAAFGDSVLHTSVAFQDSSIDAVKWHYTFGDGDSSLSPSPTHNYSHESAYMATLIVSNSYCADTTTRFIRTDTCPRVSFTYRIANDTVFFTADTSNGILFHWHFGDGDSADGRLVYHVYNHSQNYFVALWVSSAKACATFGSAILNYTETGIDETPTHEITIHPNPAHGELNANCSDCELIVYDCLGRIMLKDYVISNKKMDISVLNKGYYQVGIYAQGKSVFKKLIIE